MPRLPVSRALAVVAFAGLASHASADLPSVLDVIPAGSLGGVVAPSIASMDAATMNLFTAVGMPVLTTPSQMFAEAGFGEGLDLERPIAVAIVPGPMDGDEPPMALFLPTTGHGALMQRFGAETGAGGVSSFTMNGRDLYAKEIGGGYTIVGPMMDVISGFAGEKGQMASHKKMLGANGMGTAEASIAFGFVNMAALEPMLADKWKRIREEAAEGMTEGMERNPMAAGSVDPEQMVESLNEVIDLAEAMVNDGMYGVFGLQAGSMGVGTQFAMDFEAGSDSAAMFAEGGNSASLLGKLPAQPFIFASSYDLSCSAAGKLMELAKGMQEFAGAGQAGMHGMAGMIDGTTGGASALYPSPAGLMGGLFTGMLNYTRTPDTKAYVDSMQELAGDGGPMSLSLTRDESQVNGHAVHGWSMSFGMDPNNPAAMQMMQMTQMLFGGPQMTGYLVETEGGVYQTMSRNLTMVQSAMEGKGGTLVDSATIKQVREYLPSPAAAEGYFGFGALYQMVSPMAAMMGLQIQTQVPADLPPIGMAVAAGQSGFRAGFFAPAPVLRVGVGLAMEVQAMQGGGGDWEDDGEDAPF